MEHTHSSIFIFYYQWNRHSQLEKILICSHDKTIRCALPRE